MHIFIIVVEFKIYCLIWGSFKIVLVFLAWKKFSLIKIPCFYQAIECYVSGFFFSICFA